MNDSVLERVRVCACAHVSLHVYVDVLRERKKKDLGTRHPDILHNK